MSSSSRYRKWLRHLAAGAMAFAMVGFAPDVVDLVTHDTDTVEAQYGAARRGARRVSRRTASRTVARQDYMYSLPAGYTTVVRSGTTYYVAGGTYYQPIHTEGQVAYVVVDDVE